MTQLILDTEEYNIALPESRKGGYEAVREDLGVEVIMASGRMTREVRGTVWRVSYQYGYFDDATKSNLIAACEKGRRQSIQCGFLAPDSTGALTYSRFLVTDISYPRFMWSRRTLSSGEETYIPMWGGFSVEIREVKPSD